MTRAEAEALVAKFTVRIEQYSAVKNSDARFILGGCRFMALLAKQLTRRGPRLGFMYPWNIVDALLKEVA